ncbi:MULTISPECIES: LPS export ABC transporter permease LptF [Caulobacter]|jgi:lipopolysaccharide export system permease protein|uniref:Lipopolysaccharide export system permease protein LptF n=1 Tax=Caulobacter vibrioides OR37 TaxID=1292034 RepID=R0ERF3_CAUVI|nr:MULTISPECIES: LPS export ABC transporter permease LptF [Caulobacter]ENZ83582.1 putative permease [Caulobacter vibrioides OR37]MBQ1561388.1 LPS export ABC transporter permease LptF [Caulobacter sp.]
MRLIERYLFRQLLGPTLLATLALVALALLARSLAEFDILVEQRQSALVFLKMIALALPMLLSIMMPLALFVAALVAMNRLHTEQEIVVCFAGGMSRWSVISPAMRLAAMAALISLVMGLWLQPWAARQIRETAFDIKTDVTSTLVQPGQFTEPGPGLTVYAQSIDRSNKIHNLFIHQETPGGGASTYSSREAEIATRRGQPVLIMRYGSNQHFSREGVLQYTSFDEYTYDLSSLSHTDELLHYKISDRYPHELFFPDLTQDWEQHNKKKLLAEGHSRFAAPLYNIALMAMALAAVIGGPFSRLGYGKRIAAVGAAAAVIRILGFGVQAACEDAPSLNALQYLVPLAATWWGMSQIFRQKLSRRVRRRLAKTAPVWTGAA